MNSTSTKIKDFVDIESMGMMQGEVRRTTCPVCNATHEKSFIMRALDDRVAYHCYRASCTLGQGVSGKKKLLVSKNKEFKPKVFRGDTSYLTSELLSALKTKYEIGSLLASMHGIRYTKKDTLVFPLFTKHGHNWGTQTKNLNKATTPKNITYKEQDVPSIYYPVTFDDSSPIVVVEDVLSAIKLSPMVRARAILGTHMSDLMASELARESKDIVLFLDYDAIDKARKIAKKYAALANWRIIINEKDPKDTPYNELEEIIENAKSNS